MDICTWQRIVWTPAVRAASAPATRSSPSASRGPPRTWARMRSSYFSPSSRSRSGSWTFPGCPRGSPGRLLSPLGWIWSLWQFPLWEDLCGVGPGEILQWRNWTPRFLRNKKNLIKINPLQYWRPGSIKSKAISIRILGTHVAIWRLVRHGRILVRNLNLPASMGRSSGLIVRNLKSHSLNSLTDGMEMLGKIPARLFFISSAMTGVLPSLRAWA